MNSSGIHAAEKNRSKRHLIITGSRGIGKSTLLKELLVLSAHTSSFPFLLDQDPLSRFPGFTTHAVPRDRVILTDNLTGETARIGFYRPGNVINVSQNHSAASSEPADALNPCNQMASDPDGFLGLGLASITRAITSPSSWAVIDELGYLESSCPEFCDAISRLFDTKHVIAVLRSQSTPFLDALRTRDDVFVYDLDHPVLPAGCVIMASGLGKRFGSDKLMADFHGKPLISRILSATGGSLFSARIVVTRSQEVEHFCKDQSIPVLLHTMPYRNHTVRLGLSSLLNDHPELCGCMFALGDQPLLTRETLEAMVVTFSHCSASRSMILRLMSTHNDGSIIPGNPILFGSRYFSELLSLPDNSGGNALIKKHPSSVHYFPADDPLELSDADTPEELEQLKKAEFIR